MTDKSQQQTIQNLLHNLRGIDPLKRLFWSELNYTRVNDPLSRQGWGDAAYHALAEDPILFASGGADDAFHVIYARLNADRLLLGLERPVVTRLLHEHPYALFIFSTAAQDYWHFVNVKYDAETPQRKLLRRITIGAEEQLRTATERIALLDLETISPDLFGIAPLAIQTQHDAAFDVEQVTALFYADYTTAFERLRADLQLQTGDAQWAHDYALQFLNRLMFLHFVQRKRWLNDDAEFLRTFWQAYRGAGQPADTFFDHWLKVLFFEVFNNQPTAGHRHFPAEIRAALTLAPWLNGGLFRANELDVRYSLMISDARCAQIFAFLDRYNFTISESSPLDVEVAVDPEMLGKVYESLVNVPNETETRGEAGIFYTPRVEIDLMCRLALVDWLSNQLAPSFPALPKVPGNSLKACLYAAVFALDDAEKAAADNALLAHDLWPRLYDLLRTVTVVDPACGSGSFLVGMLKVLDDLLTRAARGLGHEESALARRKRIIGNSLYGVDVMDWAVHVAELRLWLQLIVETDIPPAERRLRPLLPNLTFKVRPGDSLVQEVGGINLALRHGGQIPAPLKSRITQLVKAKLAFYHNEQRGAAVEQHLRHEERRLFRDILDARAQAITQRAQEIATALQPQTNLFGEVQDAQMALERAKLDRERERLETEREQVAQARAALRRDDQAAPFVWDIAFVEIFEGARQGFDIVIGNPPYVRQEMIRDSRQTSAAATVEDKKAYKAKLARSVYTAWPAAFGYDWGKDKPQWKLDAKSDLYIYFYLHGLSLLNERGAFCFITSNSWLDVGYGANLQEFLLTRGRVKLIIDNQGHRSFASADVNTVIVLLGAAVDERYGRSSVAPRHRARFVMLTTPFENMLRAAPWQEIAAVTARRTTAEYRVFPLTQAELRENGLNAQKRYAGDKWGGKYLRAPDIYWTILEKGRDKLVHLSDIADVRFGIKTGANAFFYLDAAADRGMGNWRGVFAAGGEKPARMS